VSSLSDSELATIAPSSLSSSPSDSLDFFFLTGGDVDFFIVGVVQVKKKEKDFFRKKKDQGSREEKIPITVFLSCQSVQAIRRLVPSLVGQSAFIFFRKIFSLAKTRMGKFVDVVEKKKIQKKVLVSKRLFETSIQTKKKSSENKEKMNYYKLTIALVVFVACASAASGRHHHSMSSSSPSMLYSHGLQLDSSFNVSNPTKLKNDKTQKWNNTCIGLSASCSRTIYYTFSVSSETFRGDDRDVSFTLKNTGAVYRDGNDHDDTIRLYVTKGLAPLSSSKLNLTATDDGKATKTKSLHDETTYFVTITPPDENSPLDLVYWSGSIKVEWDEGTPTWVIVVLSVGSVLALALLIAIGYCVWARCFKQRGDYERFD
jgi:hypothetical protein